jgi:nitroreductase
MNSQIWRFFVVRAGGKRDRLARIAGDPAFLTAPVVIAACAAPYFLTRRGREQPYFMIDVPIAVTHLLLRAAELGLGAAWTFDFDEDEAFSVICAPERYRTVALVALGYIEEQKENVDSGKHRAVEIR